MIMHSNFILHPKHLSPDKFRNELKYICSEGELLLLQSRIQMLCQPDPHVGADGTYQIRSVYFDDCQNR